MANYKIKPRWKKGESGNPAGRKPLAQCLTALLHTEIEKICPHDAEKRTWKELIVLATMQLAIQGNSAALNQVWDRSDGKLALPIAGASGPVTIQVVYADELQREPSDT